MTMQRLHPVYHPSVPAFLRELAQTSVLCRLKNIGMNCGCEYTSFPRFACCKHYSRYTHSLGVALIVWHFTQDGAQAAAGLLHDVATPVFAHVVDFLNGDPIRQESTEDGTRELIADSHELQTVLHAHSLRTEQVCDYHRYPIADNDGPALSADRLEYTLGNALQFGFLGIGTLRKLYDDLTVAKNEAGQDELCFRTPACAAQFAGTALRCGKVYVSDEDRYSMQRLSELLEIALEREILTPEDLMTTEPAVIGKLLGSSLCAQWQAYRAYHVIYRGSAPGEDGVWRRIDAKRRYIDPFVAGQGRVSALFPTLKTAQQEFLQIPLDAWLCAK